MRRVLIVGGGSAGWMTAAYLNGALNDRGNAPTVKISLIESPDIPRISVGEATVPSIQHVLSVAGLDETEFMKAADATFKQSIRYQNWLHNDQSFYHHPFSRYRIQPIDRTGRAWLNSDRSVPFMETVSAQPVICDMARAPKMLGRWDMGAPLAYAYHMNAQKFADYLRDFSTARGVSHYLENVTDVEMRENGLIKSVRTDRGNVHEADIFVDCTGFRARLIGETLGVGYEDYSRWLMCDQAVVGRIPYDQFYPGLIRPYTTATALSSGWAWDIPMQDQRSVGYVHSSHFISAEEAEREWRAYEGPHAKDIETRLIKFHVGQRQKAWQGNCLAIGLAGGFIEPLESTGLYLSDLGAVMLAEHFPYTDDMLEAMAFRVNRVISNRYFEILDFINMHYCLSRRTDTAFWQEVQKPERITDRLKAKFEYWKLKPPSASDFQDQSFPGGAGQIDRVVPGCDPRSPVDTAGLWNHESYEAIMYGMHFCGEPLAPPSTDAPKTRVMPAIIERLRAAQVKLPPHDMWLQRALGAPSFTSAGYEPPGWASGRARPY
ncbi:tryptophan halogenase family protein [Henriciella mobilis]|uniref:Tryptophan 7-halogenase n=1 Tax=Henriciella mobilis TaxID=2305467 RepID=A0A399RMR6_9PROT|nr:tryptophan halogenase family protein [Henriciella mobilis]RIJ33060.1 tryptophan 7-halogenase [Henriciella mobilis]